MGIEQLHTIVLEGGDRCGLYGVNKMQHCLYAFRVTPLEKKRRTYYRVDTVQSGLEMRQTFHCTKRYSEFHDLFIAVRHLFRSQLHFPPKRFHFSKTPFHIIQERVAAFESFLYLLVNNGSTENTLLRFLSIPTELELEHEGCLDQYLQQHSNNPEENIQPHRPINPSISLPMRYICTKPFVAPTSDCLSVQKGEKLTHAIESHPSSDTWVLCFNTFGKQGYVPSICLARY